MPKPLLTETRGGRTAAPAAVGSVARFVETCDKGLRRHQDLKGPGDVGQQDLEKDRPF
jgi:hypothetical protein